MMGLKERLLRYRPKIIHVIIFAIVSTLSTVCYDYILNVRAPASKPLFREYRSPNWTAMLHEAVGDIRNLPRSPFVINPNYSQNKTCAVFPSVLDLQYSNVYWQIANTSLGDFFMYGAYYDNRSLSFEDLKGPVVRIIGVLEQYFDERIKPKDFCQLWFEGEKLPVITNITAHNYIWNAQYGTNGKYHTYLYACLIPKAHHHKVPTSVSLVMNPCDNALNALGVQYEKSNRKKGFAICVKALNYLNDISPRLIEWIEMHRLLGAEKIFFYKFDSLHPNMSKVLKHYEHTKFADVTPYTLPGKWPNEGKLRYLSYQAPYRRLTPMRRTETIPYNDCLYRNLYNYEYLGVFDIDEILMPLGNITTWRELIKIVKMNQTKDFQYVGSICFRDTPFPECRGKRRPLFASVPKHMYYLQKVYRKSTHTPLGANTKCLHKAEKAVTLHCHYPFACLGNCSYFHFEPTQAQSQHYKHYDDQKSWCEPNNTLIDKAIWRYKKPLVERTERVMKTLGFSTKQSIENLYID